MNKQACFINEVEEIIGRHYWNDIEEILDKNCSPNNTSEDTIDFVLTYKVLGKIHYIQNLYFIANYLKRDTKELLTFIKLDGLKIYTMSFKNEILYGFILTPKLKQRIQNRLQTYLASIKCKKCNSRFTEKKGLVVSCQSCGSVYNE